MCLKFSPCFMSTCFIIPVITVVVEQSFVEDGGVDSIDYVLIIKWHICIYCDVLYIIFVLSDISEQEIWFSFFRKTITVVDEILLVKICIVS